MKKYIALLLIFVLTISLCPNVLADSYDYLVEAENYTNTNFKIDGKSSVVSDDSAASGGKTMGVYTTSSGDYYAEYTVSVTNAGVYDLYLASSPVRKSVSSNGGASSWSSKIYLSVNGGEATELIGSSTSDSYGLQNRFAWYSVGGVNLNSGSNTIRFTVPERVGNYYSAFFDCFGLKASTFKLRYISSEAPMNVFEGGEEVTLTVTANAAASSKKTYSYALTDIYGNSVDTGTVNINRNKTKNNLTFDNLDYGSYTLTVGDITTGFSVVKPLSERKTYSDTPFAIDTSFASSNQWGVVLQDYAKVLALSGVSWIRDRLWFKNYNANYTDGNYSISTGGTGDTKNLLSQYGIKISTATDYWNDNIFTNTYGRYIPDDLVKAYQFWKYVGQRFGNKIDNFEIGNEVDNGGTVGSMDSPDLYAAFMKAAAIGISDGSDSMVSTQGASLHIDDSSEYSKILMRNGVLDYSAFDNVHYHKTALGTEFSDYYEFPGNKYLPKVTEAHAELVGRKEPVWVTEAGIALSATRGTDLTKEQQRVQAKYMVTSAVESVVNGADKHFFFFGPRFHEGEDGILSWGTMNEDTMMQYMYASFVAQSAMTDFLGQGRYKGKLTSSDNSVCAYLFDNGARDVIVAWSKSGTPTVAYNVTGKKYDMWGNEEGNVTPSTSIALSAEPIYILCDSCFEFAKNGRDVQLTPQKKEITDAKRVVLLQKYSDPARGGSRLDGYMISDGNNTVTVQVANLSENTVSGQIKYKTENGWTLDRESANVTIAPMSVQSVNFTITPAAGASVDYLSFYGTFDGEDTTPSTAKVVKACDGTITLEAETDAISKSSAFATYSVSGGSGVEVLSATVKEYKVTFDVVASEGGVYDLWALASMINQNYSSNCVIKVNGQTVSQSSKTPTTHNAADNNTVYWATHGSSNSHPVGWNSFNDVRLKKGKNTVVVSVDAVRNAGEYVQFALDKLVFVPKGMLGYREAENYTTKRGMYLSADFEDASGGKVAELFTYGISNPITDNQVTYDFAVADNATYDIWVLSTKYNSTESVSKWKVGIDGATPAYPSSPQTVSGGSLAKIGNTQLYWYKVKSATSLKRGIHKVTITCSEKRGENDYMLQRLDSVVCIKSSESWTPVTYGGNTYTNKKNVLQKCLLSEYDLTNVTESITLPTQIEDAEITWTSSNPSVVSADGVVNRPAKGSADVTVTLNAEIHLVGRYNQSFTLTVKALTDNNRTPELNGELIKKGNEYTGVQLYGKNTDLFRDSSGNMPAAVIAKYSKTTGAFIGFVGDSAHTYANSLGDTFTVNGNSVNCHITGINTGNNVQIAVYKEGQKPNSQRIAYVNDFHPTEDNSSVDFSFTNTKGTSAYRVVINKNGTPISNIIHIYENQVLVAEEGDTKDDVWVKRGIGHRITSTTGEMLMPVWTFDAPENDPDAVYKLLLWNWNSLTPLTKSIQLSD